jgi:tRNA threonylcarbamoyladenosine biosynthesis protein TsaB
MRTLVIDTATTACSVALFDDRDLIAGHFEDIGRGHAEKLVPFIQNLPGQGRADQIAVNIGPGSFTGIRVGIAAARALAVAWAVPVSGYGCLGLVAAMAQEIYGESAPVDAVMSAGHGEYFFAQFDASGLEVSAPVSLNPAQAASLSAAPVIAGTAASALAAIRGSGAAHDIMPDARKWALIAHQAAVFATPFYGRAPDAKISAPNAQ